MIVSKFRAAAESAVRTFLQSFVGAVAVVNFTTVSLDGLEITARSAAIAAAAAALAALARPFVPLSTDGPSAHVEGVS